MREFECFGQSNEQRSFVGVAIIILMVTVPEQFASRLAIYSETLSPTSTKSELLFRARDYPLQNFIAAFQYPNWPYGYGIGTASLGVQYIVRIMHATPMGIGVENGYGQLVTRTRRCGVESCGLYW